MGILGLLVAAGDFGLLGLLQPSRVLSVIRLGWGLALRPSGVRLSSGTGALMSFSWVTGVVLGRGTGEEVRPLPEALLPFFSLALTGVMISSGGRSFRGVPSSSSSKDTKEQ